MDRGVLTFFRPEVPFVLRTLARFRLPWDLDRSNSGYVVAALRCRLSAHSQCLRGYVGTADVFRPWIRILNQIERILHNRLRQVGRAIGHVEGEAA